MREAMGEANLAVITIILIGTMLPVFYLVVPRILNSMQDKACCIQNSGTVESSKCIRKITIDAQKYLTENLSGYRMYCIKH